MSNENKLSTAPAGAVAQKTASGGALSVFADGASFNTALRMAQCLASSTVVPKEYHGNVGNCMIAIEMASRINTSPMMVKFDNAPEGLEGSERYAAIEAAADNLDTAHDNITEAIEALRAAME